MRNRFHALCIASLASLSLAAAPAMKPSAGVDIRKKLDKYTTVRLEAELSALTPAERSIIPHLIEAAREMDEIFWQQAFGDREPLMAGIADQALRRYVEINYGPWDRLEDNAPETLR